MASTLIFSFFAVIWILSTIPPSMSSPKIPVQGFEARLIHRDSPESPLYNPKATRAQLLESARRRSIARQNYFKWLMSGKTWHNYISAPLDLKLGNYMMRYKIGTPRVETYGIFDTGSSLSWLQCRPCVHCFKQGIPIYDRASSDSFEKVWCGSTECKAIKDPECPYPHGECEYKIEYEDGASSEGVIAKETMMFDHDGLSGNINLTNMIFGCGDNNKDPNQGDNPPGVVALSRESPSFVSQIGFQHFSYCFSQNEGAHGSVKFGAPVAVITEERTQTPLLSGQHGFYYLSLEGISVEGTMLNIPKSVFNMTPKGGGVIMDTGTTYSELTTPAFNALKQEIIDSLPDLAPQKDEDGVFPLCYGDDLRLDSAPEIVFHFTRLQFPLSADNTWKMNSHGKHCLAIFQNDEGYSVLGSYQHRNVNVGYDFSKNIVSFKYTNCQ